MSKKTPEDIIGLLLENLTDDINIDHHESGLESSPDNDEDVRNDLATLGSIAKYTGHDEIIPTLARIRHIWAPDLTDKAVRAIKINIDSLIKDLTQRR